MKPRVCSSCGVSYPDPTIRYSWEHEGTILCSRCYYTLAIEIKGSPKGKSWPTIEEIFDLYKEQK